MKKAILAQKVLASVLAIGLGGFMLPLAAQANSGLSEGIVSIKYVDYYVGCKGAANNMVVIDRNLDESVIGGVKNIGDAEKNSVTINGCTINGNVYGGFTVENGNVISNVVNINGGTIESDVCGGVALCINDVSGEGYYQGKAINNSVNINGGTIKKAVYGGRAGYSTSGNVVNMSGGFVGDVYGGYTESDGDATGNSVNISGGKVKGFVYGGCVQFNLDDNESSVTGNTITLSGMVDLSEAAIYGGDILIDYGTNSGIVEGNKLIINGWSGNVDSLNNFNFDGAKGGVEVNALGGGLDLVVNKTTNFIKTTKGIFGIDYKDIVTKTVTDIQAGVALIVSGEIGMDNQNIYITPTSVRINDQTAITTESRAAAAAFVNQGAEVVSDSINSLQGAEAGISTFATVSGNNSKYDTGSYVDINGWNGIVGVAKTKDLNAGKFSYGAFFENGGGNYNTYNDFNGTSFRGDGNVVYNGGGLLMRYEQENGVYTEASLRAGTAKNEVSNVLEFVDNRYGFKTENAYYGAHIGIGKIIKLDNGKAWDIYGKYFHTHHEGDSVKIANDVFDFDSVDSDKLRIGARFSEQQGEKLTSYYGLAWEYEFSGDAGGTANHYAMYTPSLEGSTVIGEVGFRYTPGKASPWYFDANVRGYAGMQEGISGSVQAVYSF